MNKLKNAQIENLCKKHPRWRDLFLSYLKKDKDISMEQLNNTFSLILKHKSIFKNLIKDAKTFLELNDNRSVIERLNDKVVLEIHNHNKISFINSLKTKKYTHLFNEMVEDEIHIILDNKISIHALKHQFFNKLAKYQSSDELFEGLKSFKEKNIGWNREYYLNKIKDENLNVKILDNQNGYMNIQVNDYKACQSLGSQAWCIVQEEETFLNYTQNLKRQIIAFNFDLPIENEASMIGFTLNMNGKIQNSYLKNDEPTPNNIKETFQFKNLSKEEIKNYLNQLNNNQKAFSFICQFGLIDFFDEYINKNDVDPSANNNEAIRLSVRFGHIDVVNRLLENEKVDPSANDNEAIRNAAFRGYIDVVNRLLKDERVDPSDRDNGAIRNAASCGHIDVVNRLLKDERVDPSANNNGAIRDAARYGHIHVVNRLLEDKRVDPSANENEAIRSAIIIGHIHVVNRLLEDKRVDPSANENEAILYAVHYGHIDVVNRLLEDKLVCKKLSKDFINKLNKEQKEKYKSSKK